MVSPAPDLHQTVKYEYSRRELLTLIAFGLFGFLSGLFILNPIDGGSISSGDRWKAWALFAAGVVLVGLALYKFGRRARNALILSPRGIVNLILSKNLIPWSEVLGMRKETIDSGFRTRLGTPIIYEDVTVVAVSRAFYDAAIDPGSAFWRGPAWGAHVIEGEDGTVGIAIHHEVLGVANTEIWDAIEARWRAFGGKDESPQAPLAGATRPLVVRSRIDRHGTRRAGSAMSDAPLQLAIVVLLVLGNLAMVANAAGMWETAKQREARIEGEKWQRIQAEWRAEWAERERKDRETRESFDRAMRAMEDSVYRRDHQRRAYEDQQRREQEARERREASRQRAMEMERRETAPQPGPASQAAEPKPAPAPPFAPPGPERQASLPPQAASPPAPAASPAIAPKRVQGHREAVIFLSVAPNGRDFVSASGDRTVKLWNTGSGAPVRDLGTHKDIARAAIFLPDGERVLSAGDDGAIVLRAIVDGGEIATLRAPGDSKLWSFGLSPDGRRALAAYEDGTLAVFDVAAKAARLAFNRDGMRQQAVTFTRDGRRALTGGTDGVPRLWDIETGTLLREFGAHCGPVYSIAVTPDGARAITGGGDSTMRLWDLATGSELRTFDGHTNTVYSVAISDDGTRVLSGSIDGTARLWDAATGAELRRIAGHRGAVFAVAFAADDAILTGGDDRTIRIWDRQFREAMRYFPSLPD